MAAEHQTLLPLVLRRESTGPSRPADEAQIAGRRFARGSDLAGRTPTRFEGERRGAAAPQKMPCSAAHRVVCQARLLLLRSSTAEAPLRQERRLEMPLDGVGVALLLVCACPPPRLHERPRLRTFTDLLVRRPRSRRGLLLLPACLPACGAARAAWGDQIKSGRTGAGTTRDSTGQMDVEGMHTTSKTIDKQVSSALHILPRYSAKYNNVFCQQCKCLTCFSGRRTAATDLRVLSLA